MQTQSYVHGTSDIPLMGLTIGDLLAQTAAAHGESEALVSRHQELRYTYAELDHAVDRVARALMTAGLAVGDRVGIWSPNRAEWVLVQFATARMGAILVNINPAYRSHELAYVLEQSGVKLLVTAPRFRQHDYRDTIAGIAPELAGATGAMDLRAAALPELRGVVCLGDEPGRGMTAWSNFLRGASGTTMAELRERAATLQFDDPINIQYTSGTTGFPKGATLSHHNILNNGFFIGEFERLTPADRVCIPVPLYHCFGMVLGNLACTTHGAAMVYPGPGFDPLAVLQTVAGERCTGLHGVPTMFIAELEHPEFDRFDLSSLRTGIMAGSPCPIEVMRRAVERMHLREITICYGMTETSPVSFQSSASDPLERRVSTVGRVHPHLEVKIVDAEGRIVPRGVPGELCTRGYSVMLGYWDDEARTRGAIDAARWMHTGDLAVVDDEGFCNIVGRIKDVVIRGGENVYPREVEEFLYQHPAIQDVQVFGVADDRYGEELCAWVKLRGGEALTAEAVQAFCRGQIAHQKVPRYVRFVEEFPMTVTGKMQKFLMREAMERELGVRAAATA